jgi:hypothetical protein
VAIAHQGILVFRGIPEEGYPLTEAFGSDVILTRTSVNPATRSDMSETILFYQDLCEAANTLATVKVALEAARACNYEAVVISFGCDEHFKQPATGMASLLREAFLSDLIAPEDEAFKAIIIVVENTDPVDTGKGESNRIQPFKNVAGSLCPTLAWPCDCCDSHKPLIGLS